MILLLYHMMHRFPKDQKTRKIERQFMWGDGLLISPAFTEGATTVEAYLPESERWYDLHNVSYPCPELDIKD